MTKNESNHDIKIEIIGDSLFLFQTVDDCSQYQNVCMNRDEALRLGRILTHWAETGELKDDCYKLDGW